MAKIIPVLKSHTVLQFAIKISSWSQNQIMQPHFTRRTCVMIKTFNSEFGSEELYTRLAYGWCHFFYFKSSHLAYFQKGSLVVLSSFFTGDDLLLQVTLLHMWTMRNFSHLRHCPCNESLDLSLWSRVYWLCPRCCVERGRQTSCGWLWSLHSSTVSRPSEASCTPDACTSSAKESERKYF